MTPSEIKEVTAALTKQLVDSGQLVAAGWVSFKLALKLDQTSVAQQNDMRHAFYAGALHTFTSMITFMEAGTEPTDKDMLRMDHLSEELKRFQKELEARIARDN